MPEAPKPPKADPKTKKVLAIDDDDEIRSLFQDMLEAEGFKVKVGRDGRNIVKDATEFQPDLIITDLMMPGGGGYDVLRSLQGEMTTRNIPVFIISGFEWDKSTLEMLKQEPNARGFFSKPIRPVAFLDKVHEILNTKTKFDVMMEQRKIDEPPDMKNLMDKFFT
ncbi:MAG: response regulator [Elusimicrobia bacterium]|nr:response regulator [Candidatus Obscuribacterium magneticum]